jgi:hypothetical protein
MAKIMNVKNALMLKELVKIIKDVSIIPIVVELACYNKICVLVAR